MSRLCIVVFIFSLFTHQTQSLLEFVPLDNDECVAKDWWETAAFYQIYPRSFKDSNGDGIGDLRGITERLDYLKRIGLNAFWMSPIYMSPMADFGYDISDFYNIQPEYGTMADFAALVEKAHALGLKVIMDFVPNHSSDENEWFIKSAQRDPEYADFYIWHPGRNVSGQLLPPTNWVSLFRFSAWTWHDTRKEFYFHQFHRKQPDLNYRNPNVVEKMKSVLRYWMDKGVDGFRIDAVPHLFEVAPDKDGNLPDEPLSHNTNDPNDYGYLNHIYTTNLPETIDMVYQWRAVMDKYQANNGGSTRVIMTEAYSGIDIIMKYYGNATTMGAHMPFNFQIIQNLNNNSNAYDLKRTTDIWMNNMPTGHSPNWVMGNHDQNRVGSRLGTDRIDMMNMMLLTLSGASVTYNGEELGMSDVWISWKDTKDPAACNTNPNDYWKVSRDPERTPFQWDSSTSAGFSTSNQTWLPLSPDYMTVNVALEENGVANSHLKVYEEVMKLRKTETMMYGSLETESMNQNIFAVVRKLSGRDTYITLLNFWNEVETVDITRFGPFPKGVYFLICATNSRHIARKPVPDPTKLMLQPKESFILTAPSAAEQREDDYYQYNLINPMTTNGNLRVN